MAAWLQVIEGQLEASGIAFSNPDRCAIVDLHHHVRANPQFLVITEGPIRDVQLQRQI